MRWPERLPKALAALLLAVTVTGVSWALFQPAFQVTDEDVHFAYVHTLAERGALPGRPDGNAFASEMYGALDILNSKASNFSLAAKPEWAESAQREWRARAGGLSRADGGGFNSASSYPPAYYLSLVPAYSVLRDGDVFTRLVAARLGSVLWLLLSTLAAWLLAGEMFGRRRHLQLACAAVVGMWPMLVYVSAGVNPDAMQTALWTLAFWMGVRVLRQGLTARDGTAFGAIVGLALVCKATSLALLPAAAALLLLGTWRVARSAGLVRALAVSAPAVIALALPALLWVLIASQAGRAGFGQAEAISTASGGRPFIWREFGSYVWQFYLPRLPFQQPVDFVNEVISNFALHNIWFGHFFGVFGWTNVWFPTWAYDIFLAVLLLLLAGAAVRGWHGWRAAGGAFAAARRALPFAVFFGLAVAAVLAGLHLTEYRQYLAYGGPFMQGRYLLPLIGLFALVVTAGLNALPRRSQGVAVGLLLGALTAYQLGALGVLLGRFYA